MLSIVMLLIVLAILGLVATTTVSQFLSTKKRPSLPGSRTYVALIIVSIIMRVLGWTTVVLAVLAIPVVGIAQSVAVPDISGAAMGVSLFMVALVAWGSITSGILLVGAGQLILVLIDIERNTRGAEHYTEQTKQAIVALLQAIARPRIASPGPQRQAQGSNT